MPVPSLTIPYNPLFLGGGFEVPLPQLTGTALDTVYNDGEVFDYVYYSLVMSATRSVALFTAHNVDGQHKVQLPGRRVNWKLDDRLGTNQIGPEAYDDNDWDKGHLVRREDMCWGAIETARAANDASFYYPNAAPQHANFNQDEWKYLEDWVLEQAAPDHAYRLCVFTGPVLNDEDEELGRYQIPGAFWKIIVARDRSADGGDLSVTAFYMSQTEAATLKDKRGKKLKKLKTYQVPVELVESMTDLDFGDLKEAGEIAVNRTRLREEDVLEATPRLITSPEDIMFSGSQRRAERRALTSRAVTRGSKGTSLTGITQPREDEFDARAAYESLSQDFAAFVDQVSELLSMRDAPAGQERSVPESAATPSVPGEIPRTSTEAVGNMLRIVGGVPVRAGEFMSCCCIGEANKWSCTGVLILPQVVLTAAHCGQSIRRVFFGQNIALLSRGVVIDVKEVIRHENYSNATKENDLSLLILDSPAPERPIDLASPNEVRAAETTHLVGFGYNDPIRPYGFGVKRRVEVPIASIDRGESVPESDIRELGFDPAHEFVAGRKFLGRDSCNGDSGGPAYIMVDGVLKLAGITSRATRSAAVNCGDGGIYVRPDTHIKWIIQTLQSRGIEIGNP